METYIYIFREIIDFSLDQSGTVISITSKKNVAFGGDTELIVRLII